MTTIRPSTPADVEYLAPRLRHEDALEIALGSGHTAFEALEAGLALSCPHAFTFFEHSSGAPYAMCGVRPLGDNLGIVWLLATPEVRRHAFTFQKAVRTMLIKAFTEGGYLAVSNVALAGNSTTVRWLRRMGFTFTHEDIPIGRLNTFFHAFTMHKGHLDTLRKRCGNV